MNTKLNIEIRIADRLKSIFASFGQIVNDFYLEAGIYFVGGFNAVLVAWDIHTSLVSDGQPLIYAVAIAIISFIAVEGLAVYLVGAAAKTNNALLWFFSVVFAGFFTYAHYREMSGQGGIISQYITLAIPFFVVVGYWARTVKVQVENDTSRTALERENEIARQRHLKDEERKRRQDIEDEERKRRQDAEAQKLSHELGIERLKIEGQQVQKMAKIEGQKSAQSGQKVGQMNQMDRQNDTFEPANRVKKTKKMDRQNDLVDLVKVNSALGPTELTKRLNDLGHSASISTVKRDIKALNGVISK